MRLDPETTSLLVIDLQNGTVGEEGAFAGSGAATSATRRAALDSALTTVSTRVRASGVSAALGRS